jgi:hypothetical protein
MTITPAVINQKFPVPLQGFELPSAEDIAQLFSSVNQLLAAVNSGASSGLSLLSASGAVPVVAGTYEITKAGVAALTLAAPTAGTQDNLRILIVSATAYAHTVTATGLLQTGTASVNVATFAAYAGAALELIAYNGKWQTANSNAITFS